MRKICGLKEKVSWSYRKHRQIFSAIFMYCVWTEVTYRQKGKNNKSVIWASLTGSMLAKCQWHLLNTFYGQAITVKILSSYLIFTRSFGGRFSNLQKRMEELRLRFTNSPKRAVIFSTMKESQSESHSVVSDSLQPHGLYSAWNSLGQNTGVGSRSLLQGIFPTQGLNPGLPYHRQILYPLSHQGSPSIIS